MACALGAMKELFPNMANVVLAHKVPDVDPIDTSASKDPEAGHIGAPFTQPPATGEDEWEEWVEWEECA